MTRSRPADGKARRLGSMPAAAPRRCARAGSDVSQVWQTPCAALLAAVTTQVAAPDAASIPCAPSSAGWAGSLPAFPPTPSTSARACSYSPRVSGSTSLTLPEVLGRWTRRRPCRQGTGRHRLSTHTVAFIYTPQACPATSSPTAGGNPGAVVAPNGDRHASGSTPRPASWASAPQQARRPRRS